MNLFLLVNAMFRFNALLLLTFHNDEEQTDFTVVMVVQLLLVEMLARTSKPQQVTTFGTDVPIG